MAKKPQSVLDLLNEQIDHTGETGDHGDSMRGWWPIDGRDMSIGEARETIINCYITQVEFDPEGIEFTSADGEKKTDPLVQFHYAVIDGEHEGKEWKGERFWIPLNCPAPTTKGQQTARRIEASRFIGHYETVTGEVGGAGMGMMIQRITEACNADGKTLAVEVKCSVRCIEGKRSKRSASGEDEGTTTVVRQYWKEHLVSLLEVE